MRDRPVGHERREAAEEQDQARDGTHANVIRLTDLPPAARHHASI
jgi:hypothetical protein